MSNFQSKCMYCGSTSYGSGCIFSAHRIHIHVDDPTKCIYCGMMAYGSGCIFNPFTRMHVHGMDVGQFVKETTHKTLELSFLIEKLFKDIRETEAFKIKLINENGVIIRTPENLHEKSLISPLSNLYNNIKKYITPDAQTALEAFKLINSTAPFSESVEEYENKLIFEQEITTLVKQIKSLINKNFSTLSCESIESAIESAIINS